MPEKKSSKTSHTPSNNDLPDQKSSSKLIYARLFENSVIVDDHQNARIIYDNGFYGQLNPDKSLSLNFEEALHLKERGIIAISDQNGVWLEISDCARIFSEQEKGFWTDYLVYKDIRNRGYIVGRGISTIIKYRVYPRGGKVGQDIAKTLICPLAEGHTISIETLDEIVRQSQSLRKRILIACVDRLGDVSYYELQPLFNEIITSKG